MEITIVAVWRVLGLMLVTALCLGAAPAAAAPAGTPLQLRLTAPEAAVLQNLRRANSASARAGRGLRIGYQRQIDVDPGIAPITARSPYWQTVAGGRLLRVTVTSAQAAGLRLELRISADFAGELRFSSDPVAFPAARFGPYRRQDWQGQPTYWGPVTAGDSATLEVFVPAAQWATQGATQGATDWRIELLSLSHLFVLPTDRNAYGNIYNDTGTCETNIACASGADIAQAASAVAVMSFIDGGYSYVCTGSLLADSANSGTAYFYTAHHCVNSQSIANTLNTYWQQQDSKCTGVTDPYTSRKVLTRGATYLDSEPDNDHSLLQLKESPPMGATFLAWDSADVQAGASILTIHQPNGDVKKISHGHVDTPASTSVTMSDDFGNPVIHSDAWSVVWTSGVTEGGSSGAALLSCDGSSCRLRGGLIGGSSVCRYDNGPDFYSKIGTAYPRLKRWLANAPSLALLSASFTASPNSGAAPLLVGFNGRGTSSVATDVLNYNWHFGDSRTSTQQNPSHTYSSAGVYSVTLTVSNATGQSATAAAQAITVAAAGATSAQSDCVFAWGEANYPSLLLPAAAPSLSATPYYYRYYGTTAAYLGVSAADQHLYYLGPVSSGQLLDLGLMSTWVASAGCQ